MTEREQFMKWLDTCPFEREHMYEDKGKHYTKVRVLFSFSSSDDGLGRLKNRYDLQRRLTK